MILVYTIIPDPDHLYAYKRKSGLASNNQHSLQARPTFSSKDLQINPKMGTLTEAHLEHVHKPVPERF